MRAPSLLLLASLALVVLASCAAPAAARKHHHPKQPAPAAPAQPQDAAAKQRAALPPLPTTCTGYVNTNPLVTFDASTATVLGTVANGTLQSVLPAGSSTPLLVLQLWGDDYNMGYAYGQLLTTQLSEMIPAAYSYFGSKYHLSRALVDDLLDLTRNTTKNFTPPYHFEFMQGVSDGTGGNITFVDFWRIAMIPEAIKAMCSITGAWGAATATGGLLQLRALDWGTDGPFQQWPLLTTFHPNDGSFAYSSLGWVGMYGTLTGFSSSKLGVSEKVWYAYKGLDNVYGYPWTFLLADIMRFDADIDAALSRIGQAVRTCAIWVGLGHGAHANPRNASLPIIPADFKLLGYSFEQLHIYNPENFPIYNNHDYFPDLLFVNKDVQPSDSPCMNSLYHWGYGSLTADLFYSTITALEQTGDMHIAVMDYDAATLYIANAAPMPDDQPAYRNGFVQIDAAQLWAQQAPGDKFERLAMGYVDSE